MKKKIQAGFMVLAMSVTMTGCCMSHEWKEATCVEPKTCMKCGETEGELLEHRWIEASCTNPRTCEGCNTTDGEALEHAWREATLDEPKTCESCGLTEGTPNREVVLAVADSFLKAMDEVNREKIEDSCTGFVLIDMGLSMLSTKACEDAFYNAAEIEREWLNKDVLDAVSEYAVSCADALIEGYTIKDVTECDGVYTILACINTYEESALHVLETEEMERYLEELVEDYVDENMDELMGIYLQDGEEGYLKQVYNDLIPQILSTCDAMMDSAERREIEILFNIEKQGDRWVITSMDRLKEEDDFTI